MRVGADDGIRVGEAGVVGEDDAGEVFEVDLVHDARVWRHHGEVVEGRLAPAQEGVALAVPLELEQRVQVERVGRTIVVHHDRVIDHELGGNQRVDAAGIAAEPRHRVAHGSKVDDGGDAGKV